MLNIPEAPVIAVGQTTMTTATTTTAEGAQTTESLPLTLFTLAVDQKEAEKVWKPDCQRHRTRD